MISSACSGNDTYSITDINYIKQHIHQSTSPPILIILMPGSLHLTDFCLRLMPTRENIILILNGLDNWEKIWVGKNLRPSIAFMTDTVLDHPLLLNCAFTYIDRPFGIIDYDCFFTPSNTYNNFTNVTQNTLGNALFAHRIPKLNMWLPHTHALFFNTVTIKEIFEKYSVDCNRIPYQTLSPALWEKIKPLGITDNNLPEEDFNFDTCILAILLAMTEQKFFKRLESNTKPLAHHIGCISNPEDISSIWRIRASYFWQSALELHPDQELRSRYKDLHPKLKNIKDLKTSLEEKNDYSGLQRMEYALLFLKTRNY